MKNALILIVFACPLLLYSQKVEVNSRISVINTGESVHVGKNSGSNAKPGINLFNTAIGNNALQNDSTGTQNTAVGFQALQLNGHANRNVAFGVNALQDNETGGANVAVGAAALSDNVSGSDIVALGQQAGRYSKTGSNNTYLGSRSGLKNTSGSGNVFIGYEAGRDEMGSDKLYIENSSSSIPLVYGDFANDTVGVAGKLNVSGRLSASEVMINGAYSLTTSPGISGQFLGTNGAGQTSWQSISVNPPMQDTGKYIYAIKYICGEQEIVGPLGTPQPSDASRTPGQYATSINVLNPHSFDVSFVKKAVLLDDGIYSINPDRLDSQIPREPDTPRITELLPQCWALQMVCSDVNELLSNPTSAPNVPAIEGFVVITSPKELAITAVYTYKCAADSIRNSPLASGIGSSIDVEKVEGIFIPEPDSPALLRRRK